MVFSSSFFLFLFLPIVLLGYYLLPVKFRNLFLLITSLGFFASAGKKALALLIVIILVNYVFGLLVGRYKAGGHELYRRISVFAAVAANISALVFFKYLNLLVSTVNDIAGSNIAQREIVVLIGISFFIFSALSYILDVNSGKITAHKNFIEFALYISFFPKLLQGPITRFGSLLPQFANRSTNLADFSNGAVRFAQGLAKKVIIADQIAPMVNEIFSVPAQANSTAAAWIGAIGYGLQIYFDFSGYTDMAIGLGNLFGFSLPENFNLPYISTSISEFWRRWHITLSSWFRDYLFIPLEFKRRRQSFLRTETNVLIVFLLTGLWHGASWNFLIWGLWHGLFISLEVFLKSRKINLKLPYWFRLTGTLLILLIGWVIFRSENLTYAVQYLGVMFGWVGARVDGNLLNSVLNAKIITIMLLGIFFCLPWKTWLVGFEEKIGVKAYMLMRSVSFVVLFILSVILVLSSTFNPFIYFQF